MYQTSPIYLAYDEDSYNQIWLDGEAVSGYYFVGSSNVTVSSADTELTVLNGVDNINLCLVTAILDDETEYLVPFLGGASDFANQATCLSKANSLITGGGSWVNEVDLFASNAFTASSAAYTWVAPDDVTLPYGYSGTLPPFTYGVTDYDELVAIMVGEDLSYMTDPYEITATSPDLLAGLDVAMVDVDGALATFYLPGGAVTTCEEVADEEEGLGIPCDYFSSGILDDGDQDGTMTYTADGNLTVIGGTNPSFVGTQVSAPVIEDSGSGYSYSGMVITSSGTAGSPTVLSSNTIGTTSAGNGNGITIAGTSVAQSTNDSATSNAGYNLNYTSSGTSTFTNTDFEYATYGLTADSPRTNITAGIVNVYYKLRGLVQIAGEAVESATVTFLDSDGETELQSATTFTTAATGYTSYLTDALLAYSLTATDSVGVKVGELTYTASATSTGYAGSSSSALDEPDDSITVTMTATDSDDPVLSSPYPADGATGVAAGTDIEFTVTDSGSGIDPANLSLTINSEAATVTSYTTITEDEAYMFYYNPASDLSTGTVTVGITISDTNDNELDTSWSFTVGTSTTPPPPAQRGGGPTGGDSPTDDDPDDDDDDDELDEPEVDLEEILPEELEEELSPNLIILPEPQYFIASLPPGTAYRTRGNLIYTEEIEIPSDVIGHWSQPYVEFLSRVVAPVKIEAEPETDTEVGTGSDLSGDEITSTVIPETSILGRPVLEDFLDGNFGPDLEITRLQITKLSLLINGYGIPDTLPEVETKFSDVPKNDAALARIVYRAVEAGFIQGYPDGTFKPDRTVNRAEALKILFEGADVEEIVLNPVLSMLDNFSLTSNPFKDLPLTAWHAKYVLFAYVNEIVEGYVADHTFRPAQTVSRAEAVKIAVLVMQHVIQ